MGFRSTFRVIASCALLGSLAACATSAPDETAIPWTKPGVSEQQAVADRDACLELSEANRPDLGNSAVRAVRVQKFRDCMAERGYTRR
jgi:hypothetical protein